MTTHLLDPNKRHGVACNNRDARFLPPQFKLQEPLGVTCNGCRNTLIFRKLSRLERDTQ